MKTTILLISALFVLSACAGTRAGLTHDAERFGERMQKVGEALTEP